MANEEILLASDNETLDGHLGSILEKIERNRNNIEPLIDTERFGTRLPGMYRVPEVLRKQKEEAYSPSSVSIGPLHMGSPHLEEMEEVKVAYMRRLIERNENNEIFILRACLKTLLVMEAHVRECYAQIKLLDLDSIRFVEMMLIDGCFIIELFYTRYHDVRDPILLNSSKLFQVKQDLLLLENQIPFFVLENLFELTVEQRRGAVSLSECVLSFFGDLMELERGGMNLEMPKRPFHILHFLHICYLPSCLDEHIWYAPSFLDEGMYMTREQVRFKYSATKLHSMGIKFRLRLAGLFDLKFVTDRHCFCLWRRGHFRIPRFSIGESTESFLRNLIVLEYCCPEIGTYFTSHAVLMSILMDSSEDVKLLEEAGIIRNYLNSRSDYSDSSEAALALFKGVSRNTVVGNDFVYGRLCRNVMDFCSPWRLALSNGVVRMAVIVAIILNLLTLLSTVYTVLSYYNS